MKIVWLNILTFNDKQLRTECKESFDIFVKNASHIQPLWKKYLGNCQEEMYGTHTQLLEKAGAG